MSEYLWVERPFLEQLEHLGWTVIDQGSGIPTEPARSQRRTFREVTLPGIFKSSVAAINTLEDGRPWLSDKQLEDLHDQLLTQPGHSLVEVSEAVQKLLYRAQVDRNELIGEQFPNVKLIDFEHPERNHFLAINQFRIDTPGCVKAFIIPDIVLFVNGLPLVVIECKHASIHTANPMAEAFEQLLRYRDGRPETRHAGLREGEPRLFHTNQLLIRTTGEQADVGSITADEEQFFFPWKDIFPEKYRVFQPPLEQARAQETLIQGVLPPATLLDLVRSFTLFMDVGKARVKVLARYQQHRAVCKIIDRLRGGKSPNDRSGVVWHTQGSGKSLTMVFLIRKLRQCADLKDHKICLVNDRRDLEAQLGETAALTGEKVTFITSSNELKARLASDASNLNMVMVHKFQENVNPNRPDYLSDALGGVPVFRRFGVVNASSRILLMIDEAHRTQSGDLGDNIFEAFPNATRLAFTGTPLIKPLSQGKRRQKHKPGFKETIERFGQYIDTYKLQDAVNDGATVQILYEGRTADAALQDRDAFDQKVEALAGSHVRAEMKKSVNQELVEKRAKKQGRVFDDLMRELTDQEILELKKKWGTTGDLLEAEPRIKEIAADLVEHYVDHILLNGFKAQVVCSSKMAAIHYQTYIEAALTTRREQERAKPVWDGAGAVEENRRAEYRDEDLLRMLAFLQTAVVISSDGTNEKAVITRARKQAQERDAVENFKRKFDYEDPTKADTGIAFLIVCDMLLTGFDAPIEQVMYVDKKVKSHNLLQTIARVNRVAKGKSRGYIVDYIGLTQHLKEALSIYAKEDRQDVQGSLRSIALETPVMESRYRRLIQLFEDLGVVRLEGFIQQTLVDLDSVHEVLEQAVVAMKDVKKRADFEVYLKKFLQSLDIILPYPAADPFKIPAKRFGFLLNRVKERYKDESLSIANAGEKVRKLIGEHLASLGINEKIPPLELFSPNFMGELDKHRSAKAKASEMEHALRKHCTIHYNEDPVFFKKLSEKLEALIQKHKEDWNQLCLKLYELRNEAAAGRTEEDDGIPPREAPFFDIIAEAAFGEEDVPAEHVAAVRKLVQDILQKLEATIGIINFWTNLPEVSKLRGELSDLLVFSGIDPVVLKYDRIVTIITALARIRHRDIIE